jgi:hypothetical protein
MAVAQSPFHRTVNAAGSPSAQACPRWSSFVNERRSWWGAAAADGRATRPAGLLPTNAAKPETDAYYDAIRSICTKVTAAKCAK